MIDQTFLHCTQIGPHKDRRIREAGYRTWKDCLDYPGDLPFSSALKESFLKELVECQEALEFEDLQFLVSRFPTKEHWRFLLEYGADATYFDIETSGLSPYDSIVTTISAYRSGQIYSYFTDENLDDFLDLIDESNLLVTFNGSSFDIPYLERTYNVPDLGCAHVDLRWICYHQKLEGGLKRIESSLAIKRPVELKGVDGFEAVLLYRRWLKGDLRAKKRLIRYCNADAISTCLVSNTILNRIDPHIELFNSEDLFKQL